MSQSTSTGNVYPRLHVGGGINNHPLGRQKEEFQFNQTHLSDAQAPQSPTLHVLTHSDLDSKREGSRLAQFLTILALISSKDRSPLVESCRSTLNAPAAAANSSARSGSTAGEPSLSLQRAYKNIAMVESPAPVVPAQRTENAEVYRSTLDHCLSFCTISGEEGSSPQRNPAPTSFPRGERSPVRR